MANGVKYSAALYSAVDIINGGDPVTSASLAVLV